MGQILHRSATTTEAIRRAIQHSQESMRALARRHGINQKTVAKWKKRESTADRRTGPTVPRSTVLSVEQEAIIVAFRKHTLLPLDDCLYALQATIPQLTRSSLHRCLERHGISRLPDLEGDKPKRSKFDTYPIGFFHTVSVWSTQSEEVHQPIADRNAPKYRLLRHFTKLACPDIDWRLHSALADKGQRQSETSS
jgi:transposase-like protein